jgi:hypothetical protein
LGRFPRRTRSRVLRSNTVSHSQIFDVRTSSGLQTPSISVPHFTSRLTRPARPASPSSMLQPLPLYPPTQLTRSLPSLHSRHRQHLIVHPHSLHLTAAPHRHRHHHLRHRAEKTGKHRSVLSKPRKSEVGSTLVRQPNHGAPAR